MKTTDAKDLIILAMRKILWTGVLVGLCIGATGCRILTWPSELMVMGTYQNVDSNNTTMVLSKRWFPSLDLFDSPNEIARSYDGGKPRTTNEYWSIDGKTLTIGEDGFSLFSVYQKYSINRDRSLTFKKHSTWHFSEPYQRWHDVTESSRTTWKKIK